MTTYRFGLYFVGGDVRKDQLPGAMARIRLDEPLGDEEGNIFVSNQCMGPSELEGQVKVLKAELDEILQRGIKKFKDYESATLRAIDKRTET